MQYLSNFVLSYDRIKYLLSIQAHEASFFFLELLNNFEYLYSIIFWIVILYSFQDTFIFDFELSLLDEFINISLVSIAFLT